ncbi:hypothetical protein [Paenibacillus jiagnxiensis]|uniref:hypothetical protein n=1 Tax=Paenibacillus jiagnxiensis TaxID=3228926 RepID=UPI0038D3FE18
MSCGSTNDVTDFKSGEEKIILCVDCRYKLATGQLTVKQIGRPTIGITKKVSLTLPEEVWEHFDKVANGNRSEYLRNLIDKDIWSQDKYRLPQGDWSNEACLGYFILAARRLGYSRNEIIDLVRAIKGQFDEKTIDEASKAYERLPYK